MGNFILFTDQFIIFYDFTLNRYDSEEV